MLIQALIMVAILAVLLGMGLPDILNLPLRMQIIWGVWLCTGIGLWVYSNHLNRSSGDKPRDGEAPSPHYVDNSTSMSAGRDINFYGATQTKSKTLKERIRDVLLKSNPVLIDMADKSAQQATIEMDGDNLNELMALEREPGFNEYISYQVTGGPIMGIGARGGSELTDVKQTGQRHAILLTFKSALRK